MVRIIFLVLAFFVSAYSQAYPDFSIYKNYTSGDYYNPNISMLYGYNFRNNYDVSMTSAQIASQVESIKGIVARAGHIMLFHKLGEEIVTVYPAGYDRPTSYYLQASPRTISVMSIRPNSTSFKCSDLPPQTQNGSVKFSEWAVLKCPEETSTPPVIDTTCNTVNFDNNGGYGGKIAYLVAKKTQNNVTSYSLLASAVGGCEDHGQVSDCVELRQKYGNRTYSFKNDFFPMSQGDGTPDIMNWTDGECFDRVTLKDNRPKVKPTKEDQKKYADKMRDSVPISDHRHPDNTHNPLNPDYHLRDTVNGYKDTTQKNSDQSSGNIGTGGSLGGGGGGGSGSGSSTGSFWEKTMGQFIDRLENVFNGSGETADLPSDSSGYEFTVSGFGDSAGVDSSEFEYGKNFIKGLSSDSSGGGGNGFDTTLNEYDFSSHYYKVSEKDTSSIASSFDKISFAPSKLFTAKGSDACPDLDFSFTFMKRKIDTFDFCRAFTPKIRDTILLFLRLVLGLHLIFLWFKCVSFCFQFFTKNIEKV